MSDDIEPVLNNYGAYYAVMSALELGVPCLCGKQLDNDLEMYEHDGGIYVPQKVKKQWVYVTCDKCMYQNSHKKILMRARRIHNE